MNDINFIATVGVIAGVIALLGVFLMILFSKEEFSMVFAGAGKNS